MIHYLNLQIDEASFWVVLERALKENIKILRVILACDLSTMVEWEKYILEYCMYF